MHFVFVFFPICIIFECVKNFARNLIYYTSCIGRSWQIGQDLTKLEAKTRPVVTFLYHSVYQLFLFDCHVDGLIYLKQRKAACV